MAWADITNGEAGDSVRAKINALGASNDLKLPASAVSAFGLTLIDDVDAATARGTLGLVIGTNVQAYDADLTTWAGITPAAGIATFLVTPSSANLIAAITDETGTGTLVFSVSPTFTGTMTAGNINATGRIQGVQSTPSTECLNFSITGVVSVIIGLGGLSYNRFQSDLSRIQNAAGTTLMEIESGVGTDVKDLLRCDSFRIDQNPTVGVVICTHTVTINLNGTVYRFPCLI